MKKKKILKNTFVIAQKEKKNGKRNELHILDTGHFQFY